MNNSGHLGQRFTLILHVLKKRWRKKKFKKNQTSLLYSALFRCFIQILLWYCIETHQGVIFSRKRRQTRGERESSRVTSTYASGSAGCLAYAKETDIVLDEPLNTFIEVSLWLLSQPMLTINKHCKTSIFSINFFRDE